MRGPLGSGTRGVIWALGRGTRDTGRLGRLCPWEECADDDNGVAGGGRRMVTAGKSEARSSMMRVWFVSIDEM